MQGPVLAPYASRWRASRGRLVAEAPSPTRSEFQRDRDRIVHCTAFRRLAHKTQVFVPLEGDHFRTRLTHTIEVAQIARALARALGLDDDLAEALALAHDLGHTPFGHTGEDMLDACLKPHGGFDHNAQALRIVTKLERRYARFDGLNLAWETLEGLVKHNGPLKGAHVPAAIREYDAVQPLELETFAGPEAQAAAISDDIAYNAHDIDDGLRAGLFGLDALREVDFLRGLLDEIAAAHPGLEPFRAIHELGRRVITRFVENAIGESARLLVRLESAADVRGRGAPSIAFSPAFASADKAIKTFLFARMYRHPQVMRIRAKASEVVRALYECMAAAPDRMPPQWAAAARERSGDGSRVARVVGDYIAGMTDRYALSEHQRMLGWAPDLR